VKLKNNVLVQYSLATFLVTLVISLSLALLLAGNVTNYYLRSHIETFPQIVALAFQEDPETKDWFDRLQPGEPPAALKARLDRLLHLGKIFRLKVWSPGGVILWSDEPTLVGKKFDSDELEQVLKTGRPALETGEADADENVAERGRGNVLQVYTPILQNGHVVGAIELYEDNQDLFQQIAVNTRDIWGLVLAFGLILYVVLFIVFYRAYKNQRRAHRALEQTQEATVFALAFQAELRDHETGKHLERTARYVDLLARALGLPDEARGDLVRAAPLHDLGKVGIPDAILLKPGPLTPDERVVMETHCELGDSVLAAAEEKLGFRSFLAVARELVLTHHEKWDGTGYPRHLAGTEIPLSGRIMALADVYDALRSRRPYKDPRPHEACVQAIAELSGTHFDPAVAAAFTRIGEQFRAVSDSVLDYSGTKR
jgi:HD-GYP domain-containing protein (c-di-GMP phosphodiesterase class II)